MYDKKFIDLICSIKTFKQFCSKLNDVEKNKTRGTYFEYFAQLIFLNDPRYSFVKKCWMLDDVPIKVLEHLKIPFCKIISDQRDL